MSGIVTDVYMHNVKIISAKAGPTKGSPIQLELLNANGYYGSITIFLDDAYYARRLADGINGAIRNRTPMPVEKDEPDVEPS